MRHFIASELADCDAIPERVGTLVVGAGMAGLYCAWRLLQQDPDASVTILDRSNRTGGRLDSDLVHFGDDQVVKEEEGGMRFTFDTMDDLMSLFLLLDLTEQVVPFPMNSGGNNRLCYRGESFTNHSAADDDYSRWSELYNLLPEEQGMDPKSFLNTIFNRILAANPQFTQRPQDRTPEFWQDFRLECQWKGSTLNNWTLWGLFTDMGYSKECIELMYGLLGFNGTFLSQMNAGIAYQLLEDFPDDPQFRTLENGFSTLPNALVERIGTERIHLNTTVVAIEGNEGDALYTVQYTCGAEGDLREIRAEKVILALPRVPLEKLFVASGAIRALTSERAKTLWNTLQTTTNQSLLKINLYYDQAWWGNNLTGRASVAFGPNLSDLPLGSVYPFYAIDEAGIAALEYEALLAHENKEIPEDLQQKVADLIDRKYTLPAALTIYCDYLNINFWFALQNNGPLFESPLQEEFNRKDPQTLFAASQEVVERATQFFQQLFKTHYIPRPVLTSARIWSGSTLFDRPPSQQFDYAVHQWALGADDRAVMKLLTEPMERIYTCGEAYSDYQGWVEGALRSADLVLQKGFGLDPISVVYERDHQTTPSQAIKDAYATTSAARIQKYIDPDFDSEDFSGQVGVTTHAESPFALDLTYFDQQ